MPRPPKARRVCRLPPVAQFKPVGCVPHDDRVVMTVDEYEAICLIDHEGRTQQECADQMGVARTTVQSIYRSARRKVAECLVEGRRLVIEGGDYEMCPGGRAGSRRGCAGGPASPETARGA